MDNSLSLLLEFGNWLVEFCAYAVVALVLTST